MDRRRHFGVEERPGPVGVGPRASEWHRRPRATSEEVTMPEKLISELLDLPERVSKGDFVLNLSKGVTEPDKTLEQYVVTPQLADCFDDALGFIRSAVEATSSKACYLHGSFGAGKSHFMAGLPPLLSALPPVRAGKETAKGVPQHGGGAGQKI